MQAPRGAGRHEPFRGTVIEVLEDDVNANEWPWPTEAVKEVSRHVVSVKGVGLDCWKFLLNVLVN
jgi:hypothetical protein